MSQESIPFSPELEDINRGRDIIIITSVFTAFIILATFIRIGTKLVCKLRLSVDDYLIVLSLALNLVGNVIEYKSVEYGFGRHLQFLTKEQERSYRMWAQFGILFACLALWSVKISICFFILALIRGTHKYLRWATFGLIAVTTASSFCQAVLWGVQAKPLKKLWEPEIPGVIASKRQLIDSIITSTAINSITDLFYALAPIYFLARVQLTFRRKLVITALTGSGLLVFAVSIIRLCFVNDFSSADPTWDLRKVYICAIVERNLAAIIADLPAIFTLVRNLRSKIVTLRSRSATDSKRSHGAFGSGFPSRSNTKYSEYGSYNKQRPFSLLDQEQRQSRGGGPGKYGLEGAEDEIPLRDEPQHLEAAHSANSGSAIKVQTDIEVQTQQRKEPGEQDLALVWPLGKFTQRP